jgi:hypothetical protein
LVGAGQGVLDAQGKVVAFGEEIGLTRRLGRRGRMMGMGRRKQQRQEAVAAHNLGRILWKLFGAGKPKALQGADSLAALVHLPRLSWWHGW